MQATAGSHFNANLQSQRQGLLMQHRMIGWKDHCPRIDMEEQAASARLTSPVTPLTFSSAHDHTPERQEAGLDPGHPTVAPQHARAHLNVGSCQGMIVYVHI